MRSTAWWIAWGVFLASVGVAAPAAATEVRGQLEITSSWLVALEQRIDAQPEQGPPTRFWEVGNGAASVEPPVVIPAQEFGVLVRPAENQTVDPLGATEPVVEVRSVSFQPAISFVPEGMSLVVRNLDLFDHDFVVEDEKGTALPTEDIDGGRSFRIRFSASGLFVVRCRNFPFMRGFVFVEESPVRFVRPADDGSFSLGNLAPGKYTLMVFNATAKAASAPTPVAGWVATPCPLDIPAEPPAPPQAAAAPPPDPRRRPADAPAEGAQAAAAPPAPPTFRVTVRLGAQGSSERLECTAAWPTPSAPTTPAAGAAP